MVRPLLLSAGSRGDFEPLTALAIELLSSSRAESITYCVQNDSLDSVPAHPKQRIVEIPFSASDFNPLFMAAKAKATDGMTLPEVAWSAIGLMMSDILRSSTDRVVAAAKEDGCDVVVTTMCTWPVAHIASKVLGIPFVMLSFQPDLPSAFFPYIYLHPVEAARAMVAYRDGQKQVPSAALLEQARRLHRFPFEAASVEFGEMCQKFDLPPVEFEEAMALFTSSPPELTTLFAVQKVMAPSPPDFPENAHVIGSLAVDYQPPGYNPRESTPPLVKFLTEGPPPIVVSYGSHGAREDGPTLLRALLAGFKTAGAARVVILPAAAGLNLMMLSSPEDAALVEWTNDRVLFEPGNVQYGWLLPRAEMLFCHGGAGCTAAALHAGVPLLITPMMFDQFFHAEVVRLSGFGTTVGAGGASSITAELVAEGVRVARSAEVLRTVKALAASERQGERAVGKAARLICAAASRCYGS